MRLETCGFEGCADGVDSKQSCFVCNRVETPKWSVQKANGGYIHMCYWCYRVFIQDGGTRVKVLQDDAKTFVQLKNANLRGSSCPCDPSSQTIHIQP